MSDTKRLKPARTDILGALQELAGKLQNITGASGDITLDVPERIYDAAHRELEALMFLVDPPSPRGYGKPIVYQASAGLTITLTSYQLERKLAGVHARAVAATEAAKHG